MNKNKIIHVELKEPYEGKRHWYFGSVTAIYQKIPEEVMGIKLSSLWTHVKDVKYVGKKCTIRKGTLYRSRINKTNEL